MPVKSLLAVCLVLLPLAPRDGTTQAISPRPVCSPCRFGAEHPPSSLAWCHKAPYAPLGQQDGLPKCRAYQGWMQPRTRPLASTCPLALSACSHAVRPSIAAGITWRSEFVGAQSQAAMPAGFSQAGGQVLLPGLAGSSPLAFHLPEHRLGQWRGGADGAAGAAWFLGWQSRLSCFGRAVQPPSLLHPQLRVQQGPVSPRSMPLPRAAAGPGARAAGKRD